MRHIFLLALSALAIVSAEIRDARSQTVQANSSLSTHVVLPPEAITWQPIPPDWADGPPPPGYTLGHSEIAIIEGDPTKAGAPFVMRIRSTPGTQLPPHWHPIDEHITVLSGVFCVGMGKTFDPNGCRDMPAGSYINLPAGMPHFALTKGNVVQLHGVGPFKIYWVK